MGWTCSCHRLPGENFLQDGRVLVTGYLRLWGSWSWGMDVFSVLVTGNVPWRMDMFLSQVMPWGMDVFLSQVMYLGLGGWTCSCHRLPWGGRGVLFGIRGGLGKEQNFPRFLYIHQGREEGGHRRQQFATVLDLRSRKNSSEKPPTTQVTRNVQGPITDTCATPPPAPAHKPEIPGVNPAPVWEERALVEKKNSRYYT